ncbi:MAG TPA: S9 family peptidase [Pyrinomonadaceae bacterium]|nr:S9 family peptidase [Pyrinomonadaceae bacterium]
MKKHPLSYLFVLLLLLSQAALAQDASKLSIERIFNTDEFQPARFGGFRWLKDGSSFGRLEPSPTAKGSMDLVKYDIATNKRDVLLPAEKLIPTGETKPITIQGYEYSADDRRILIYTNSKRVWRQNTKGEYWVLDVASGKLTKIGADAKPSTLMFAKFSPDATRVGYVRESDLYVQNIDTGKITRLTSNGSPTMINGTSDWVNEEEFNLRDCWRWSPDGKSIAFWQFDASGIPDFYLLNNVKSLYPELTKIPYPKAGTTNAAVRVGVVSADGGDIRWMKTPGDPRNTYLVSVDWTGDSKSVYMQHFNRLQNTLNILVADPSSGEAHSILTEKDNAWVDLELPAMTWLDGGKRFLWISERSGWRQAYSVSADGKDIRPITKGDFDMIDNQGIDQTGGWFYYTASPTNAAQRYLYRSKLDGSGEAERITPAADSGWNNYNISPNKHWAVQTSSSYGKAAKISLLDLSNKSVARVIVDNAALQGKIDKLQKGPHEFFRVDVGEGVSLDAWMMKPPNFDPSKKYPILFYVYTEPAGQTVMDSWQGANYLWFLMLTQQGYIVASVDNRGTPSPRGREFRKSIYRKLGVLNSQDQANAAKAIVAKNSFIDPARVGVWGWSGGGVATLNAMFRYPDVYKMGMSVAPVADNHYYDTIYTERYLGLPKDNEADYKNAAPITFAKNLKGDLLIVHGTGDDNVHYQATEILFDTLIANNKPFTMMAYPNRSHGIFEGEGTTVHLYGLLTRYLNEHLPATAPEVP